MSILRWLFILAAVTMAAPSQAESLDEGIVSVARTHQTMVISVAGHPTELVYVGQFDRCEAVSALSGGHDQHFRVCGDRLIPRNMVAPAWPDSEENKRVLKAVIDNAIRYGHASQSDNDGYLIQAETLGALAANCRSLEVRISYDGDLVDHSLKSVCR